MANNETAHELILQILKTRMTFRQTIQRVLRTNNVDITFEMLQVMHRLWKKPGVSQQYLAEQTAKDKACLTNLINNLEKKGWVERRGNPTDRRNKQIYLTEEGERLALRVKPLLHGIYGLIGNEMPSRQIVSCRNNLQKINSILPPKHELLPYNFVQKTNFKYPYKKGSPAKELPIFLLLVFYSIFQSTLLLSILQSQDL